MIEARGIDIDRDHSPVISTEVRAQLRKLQTETLAVIESAAAVGTVVIVTNAAPGWIERSGRLCLPRLIELIEAKQIEIVYARQTVTAQDANDPTKWKPSAFSAAVDQRRYEIAVSRLVNAQSGNGSPAMQQIEAEMDKVSINIVSIGDGIYERVAARVCAEKQDLVKTIKFVDSPTIAQLRRQLRLTAEILPDVSSSTECRSIGLRTALGPEAAGAISSTGTKSPTTISHKGGLRRTAVASKARRKIEL